MSQSSNWPGGVDRGHSNFTGKFSRVSKYDGVGSFAKDSHDIPIIDAILYVGGTAAVIWATVHIALWIVANQ